MIWRSRFSSREISIHGVNALGISAFASFMLHWPHFYDAGPPVDLAGLSAAMAWDILRLYLVVFAVDILSAFVFPSREGVEPRFADYFFAAIFQRQCFWVYYSYSFRAGRGQVFSRIAILFPPPFCPDIGV